MAITYSIEFAAAIARLEEGTRQGAKHVKKMADDIESASNFARNALLTVAGALGIHSFSSWIRGAADAAEASAKAADKFGIQSQAMAGLRHAADLANTSHEALNAAMRNTALAGVEAARGGEEARRTFRLLNIEYAEFVRLPLDRQFTIVVEKLGQVENVALRNALAQQVFKKSADEVMNMIADGAEGIRRATEDAKAWGLALNRVDSAKIEMAKDAITRAQSALQGIATTIAVQLAPFITVFANKFADAAKKSRGFKNEIGSALESVAVGVTYVLNAVRGLEFGWVGLKYVIASVTDAAVQGLYAIAKAITESKLVEWAQYIPGPVGMAAKAMKALGTTTVDTLGEMARWTSQNAESIAKDLAEIGERGIIDPEEVRAKFRAIRAAVEAEARAIAKRREELGGSGIGVVPEDKKDDTTWKQGLAKQVERLQIESMTELQLLEHHVTEKRNIIDIAAAEGLIDDEVWQAQTALITAKYEAEKTRIIDEETKKRYGISQVYRKLDLDSAGFFFGQMSQLMHTKSRTLFEIGKAGAIAGAIIDTYKAATGAYASLASIPIIGPALGAAAAAAAIAVGMARVSAIRSATYGGGAAAGGASGTFSANPATGFPEQTVVAGGPQNVPLPQAARAQERQQVNLTIIGSPRDTIDLSQVVDELVPLMKNAGANGAFDINLDFRPA